MKSFLHHRAVLNVLHQYNHGRLFCTSPISQTLLNNESNSKCSLMCNKGYILKVDFITVRHFSFILPRDQYTNKILLSDKSTHPSFTFVRHNNSIGRKSIPQKFMESVDFDKLKEQIILEQKSNNDPLQQKLKEIMNKKCDEAILALNEKDSKALKVIQLEYDFSYSEGYRILPPEEMKSKHWLEALNLSSAAKRLKYYIYLSKIASKKKDNKRKAGYEGVRMDSYEHGRLFLRIYESAINRSYDYKLASAMVHGNPLILDLDFTQHMRYQDIRNTAKQLRDLYHLNRKHATPFHLHFTNCHSDNSIYKSYQMFKMSEKQIELATVTPKSYLDIFDKDRLVYLSPEGENRLHKFDPDDIFIVGAFNDKANPLPISYARAKQQKIRCAKLPLDDFVDCRLSKKVLSLDCVMSILLTYYETKSWTQAFQHIPKRIRIHDVYERREARFHRRPSPNFRR